MSDPPIFNVGSAYPLTLLRPGFTPKRSMRPGTTTITPMKRLVSPGSTLLTPQKTPQKTPYLLTPLTPPWSTIVASSNSVVSAPPDRRKKQRLPMSVPPYKAHSVPLHGRYPHVPHQPPVLDVHMDDANEVQSVLSQSEAGTVLSHPVPVPEHPGVATVHSKQSAASSKHSAVSKKSSASS